MIVENIAAPHDQRVWPEALMLHDCGYRVSVISPKGNTDCREAYAFIDGIHVHRYNLPSMGVKYVNYILEYSIALVMTFLLSLKVWFRHGFDVIHVANPPDIFFMMALFYRLFGKKFVFDQHDLSPEMFQVIFNKRAKIVYNLMRRLEFCSYRVADLVIVTNESQKKIAIWRGRCRSDKVFVVRNSSNLKPVSEISPDHRSKSQAACSLGYVGVMGVQDGVEHALYALDELVHKRGRRDVSMVLFGDGPNLPTLRSLAQTLNLDEYVDFKGWVSHEYLIECLSTVDIALVPDPENGLNEFSTMIKTMDYMTLGKPIVAFDLVETRFSAQEAALYAKPNLTEDFANKIETLLDDEQLRIKMGETGRQRMKDLLGWEHSKAQLICAYRKLLGSGD